MPTISGRELLDGGYVAEANRTFFHPLGLALAVDPDTNVVSVLDDRSDPRGMWFSEADLEGVASVVRPLWGEMESRRITRLEALGFIVQPLPRLGGGGHG